MNRLEAMNLFVRVAELGSFSAAANQLGMERSVVTRQIAALEAHLGAKLMVRSTRHLSLTSAGAAYLERCRVILEQVEEAEAAVMEERLLPSGQLRISLPLSFGLRRLAPILSDFAVMYPDIRLLMDFSDKKHNQIEEAIDLSIRITSRLDPGDIVRRLGSIQLITAAARPTWPDTASRSTRTSWATTPASATRPAWTRNAPGTSCSTASARPSTCTSACWPTTATP